MGVAQRYLMKYRCFLQIPHGHDLSASKREMSSEESVMSCGLQRMGLSEKSNQT